MKKIFAKYIPVFATLLVVLSGCKKLLDLEPIDQIPEDRAFETVADLQKGTSAVYGMYGWHTIMFLNAVLSDEIRIGPGNAGFGQVVYRYQYRADETSGEEVSSVFFNMYGLIDQANRVLAAMDRVETNGSGEATKNLLKAQLLAMRGIAHFEVLKLYSKNYDPSDSLGVSYMTKSDLFAKPERKSVAESVALIEKDFADADALLPNIGSSEFSDLVINKINLAGFRARLALYKRDWQAAVAHATTVINSNVKPLSSGTNFQNIWRDAGVSEILFRIRFNGSGVGSIWTGVGGTIDFSPSNKLIAQYDQLNDIRFPAYFQIDGLTGAYYVNKFYESSRGGRIVDAKAMRTAEMYLIRAEANAEINTSSSLTAATADLNLLRSQRISGYVNESFPTRETLLSAIINERYKELAFEGFRFNDLKRKG
ncbi:MAG TPA: RagB/SusD family nutrient uptake outer membrane protein, partial [Parasegetibacter sp.]